MRRALLLSFLIASCSPARPAVEPRAQPDPQLARFMREMINVPYSIAQLSVHQRKHEARVSRAATLMQTAVEDLVHWADPPGASDAARAVFVTYAQMLEHHVERLEVAARARDGEETAHSLEDIRQTCNQCHRLFRPANKISSDVAIDLQGGTP
jgi:cytochrome c556